MHNKVSRVVLQGLLCCGLFMQLPQIQAHDRFSTIDKAFMVAGTVSSVAGAVYAYMVTRNAAVAVSSGLLVASSVKGLYNVRYYNHVLSQCELDYGFELHSHWTQYPAQFGQDVLCLESSVLSSVDTDDHGACFAEIQRKITVFDMVDPRVIWNFEKFKDILPHTNIESSYCIAKSYIASFNYKTLGALKSAISYQIAKIEYDFDRLVHLTDLSWSRLEIPKNLDEHLELKLQLSACSHCYGVYALLGAFGYSPVHNGQRAKDCLLALSNIHAFLINFQELLKACTDSDETKIIDEQGVLKFSLQNNNLQKKI